MKKMRVFELAKELSIDAKELLRIAKDLAISVESTMSVLDVHDMEDQEAARKRHSEEG